MASSVSELTRMSGLVSGLDIESLVKAGTANTKNSINSRKQKLQTLQWKQEAYRSVISSISDFQSKYLDILSSSSIRANSVMKSNKATSSNESLSVSASTSAIAGKYSITSVKTAKAASLEGTKASASSVTLDFSNASAGSNTVKVTLDGTTKSITFNGGENAKDNFLTALNKEFDGVTAAQFEFVDGSNKLNIKNGAGDNVSHIFTVGYSTSVGLKNDASNVISTSSTIGSLDFVQSLQGDSFEFTINGTSFSFDKDTTIKEMMNTINKSDAGVTMTFSGLTQSFSLSSSATGAGQSIEITQQKGNLINSVFNLTSSEISVAPTKATLSDKNVDDTVAFTFQTTNTGFTSGDSFTINGKELKLNGLTQSQNTDKIKLDPDDDTETSARLYKDADGNTIYRYVENGSTYYAKKNGDTYETVMKVSAEGVVNYNGQDLEDVTEEDQLKTLGIEKDMKTYTADDYKTALEDAYKASFPDGSGKFTVSVFDDGKAIIHFMPESGEKTSVSASGNVTAMDTGYGSNGTYTNYTENPYDESRVVINSDKASFTLADGTAVTINGTGTDGKVTIKDLTDSGYFAFDSTTGELSVTGKNMLTAADSATSADVKEIFGTVTLAGADNVGTLRLHGENAQMTVNGVTLESSSNSFSIDGTTFNIADVKEFTQADIASGDAEEITVDVSKDTSKIKEAILGFVEAYNELLDTINTQLSTSRPKSDGDYYDPLTEEQEEEMEQDEIDKWNEQAKTGLLYHDSTLSRVFTSLRQAMSTASGGMTIQALGIDTSDDYTEYGKLVIDDESVLDTAIEKYGDEIADFFTNTETGLGTVLNNAVNAAIDTSTNKNGYPKGILTSVAGVANTRSDKKNYIYSQIETMQTIIDKLNEKYENEQERLWSKYTTLETYISNMNNQSSSLFGTDSSY